MIRAKAKMVLLFSVLSVGMMRGQSISTMGKDFWLAFMDNNDTQMGNNMLKVLVSGKNACSVTLSNPNTNWSTTAIVQPNLVTTISVPQTQGYNSTSGQVKNYGLHLTATDTVSVYTSILGIYNYEAANVYPTNILRDEYMIQSYPSDRYGSAFNIVATEDSTYVDIVFSSATSFGGYTAGDTITVLLPTAGKSYQVKSPAVGDFSGTKVKARECKKIAVFHGDVCVYVPDWASGHTCDHAEEQAVPTVYWGKDFVVVNTQSSLPDRIRVTALYDSCTVTGNGFSLGTLNAGESLQFNMTNSTLPRFIHTTTPASVNSYFASTNNGTGDPSMVTINPLEQKIKEITFGSFNTTYTTNHYICVVAKTSEVSQIKLDGSTFTSSFSTLSYDPTYSYAKKQVTAGSHTLKAMGGEGFVAYAFGMGTHESYAYSLGSCMRDLGEYMNINENEKVTEQDTTHVCENDTIEFSITTEYEYDSIVWFYDNNKFGEGVSVSKSFYFNAIYPIHAYIYRHATECNTVIDTLLSYVRVNLRDTTVFDTVACHGHLYWYGQDYYQNGCYTHYYYTDYGCKNVIIMNLYLKDDTTAVRIVEGCDSVLYKGVYYHDGDTVTDGVYTATNGCDSIDMIAFKTYKDDTTVVRTMEGCDSVLYNGIYFYGGDTITDGVYTAANGCDSTELIAFKTYPSYDITHDVFLKAGDSLVWINGVTYTESNDSIYMVMHSRHGCDSIIRVRLNIAEPPHIDSMVLWVPNAFTPDEETNSEFRVFCYDMSMVHVYIYNRWGNYVTDFDGLTGSWDGTCKGRPCKEETYVYLIEYTRIARPRYIERKVGTVTLIR